jgi:hypothetical protein
MRVALVLTIAAAGLLVSCEGVCGCLAPPPMELVYGRVESATGTGIPTAVVLYRVAMDTVCVFDTAFEGEIDVHTEGRFRDVVLGHEYRLLCLELRAFDPASGQADTVSLLILADFANPDSTGVVLRLP